LEIADSNYTLLGATLLEPVAEMGISGLRGHFLIRSAPYHFVADEMTLRYVHVLGLFVQKCIAVRLEYLALIGNPVENSPYLPL
jgi:hypothetical protein